MGFLERRLCGALKANQGTARCRRWWESLYHYLKSRSDSVYSIYFNAMTHLGRREELSGLKLHQGRFRLDIGKISLLKEWSGITADCPGQWWSPHPWRGSKNV